MCSVFLIEGFWAPNHEILSFQMTSTIVNPMDMSDVPFEVDPCISYDYHTVGSPKLEHVEQELLDYSFAQLSDMVVDVEEDNNDETSANVDTPGFLATFHQGKYGTISGIFVIFRIIGQALQPNYFVSRI